jgi:hypothetical protein
MFVQGISPGAGRGKSGIHFRSRPFSVLPEETVFLLETALVFGQELIQEAEQHPLSSLAEQGQKDKDKFST